MRYKRTVAHYQLGLAYAKNANQPERRSLEQTLKLNPQFAEADDAKRVLGTPQRIEA